jgi:hypothetical protein
MADASSVVLWNLVEAASNFFYDPVVFWGAPLLLAIVWAILRRRN